MRSQRFWIIVALSSLGVVACGAPQTSAPVANLPIVQAAAQGQAAAPTTTIAPTTAAPTSTTAPTNTPEPTVVPATAEPTLAPTDVPTEPVRLQIPAIELDYQPKPVGLDENNVPIVLNHDVAWYNLSAKPGQGDNVVFWAHVLRFTATPDIPAPFARVHELQPGAEIKVTTASGKELQYRVTKAVRVKPSDVKWILPTGTEQLTLVSCIGDKVIENGFVTKTERLVTIAEPVS